MNARPFDPDKRPGLHHPGRGDGCALTIIEAKMCRGGFANLPLLNRVIRILVDVA